MPEEDLPPSYDEAVKMEPPDLGLVVESNMAKEESPSQCQKRVVKETEV
jgi:hypothetical protein